MSYLSYLVEFHATRDYFECHEIGEENWKMGPDPTEKQTWLGLIQLAVGLYHYRQGNMPGARRMINKSVHVLKKETKQLNNFFIETSTFFTELNKLEKRINNGEPFQDFNIPLTSNKLEKECVAICKKKNLKWKETSDLTDDDIVFRHKRRDRSDVINEREHQLEKRKKKRF